MKNTLDVMVEVDTRLSLLWVLGMRVIAPIIGYGPALRLAELGYWRLARFRVVPGRWRRFDRPA